MSLDNGLNISLQFTYFPFFLIKKREGGRGGVMEKKMILLLILKMIIYLFSNMCLYNPLLSLQSRVRGGREGRDGGRRE